MARKFDPSQCHVLDGNLFDGQDEILAKCDPRVLSKTTLLDPRNGKKITTIINLRFICMKEGEEEFKDYNVDIKGIEKIRVAEIDADLYTTSDRKLIAYIKYLIPDAPNLTKYSIDTLGWIRLNEKHIYCTGSELIGNVGNVSFEFSDKISDLYLKRSFEINEEAAFDTICETFRLGNPKSLLIFIFVLGALLRQLFKDAEYTPTTVVYVEAKTQSGKTTYLRGIGCPIRTDNVAFPNYTRVSSSVPYAEIDVSFYKDMLYIYDDIYYDTRNKDGSKSSKMKKSEENAIMMLRSYSDDAVRGTKISHNRNNAQLILTGEYLIEGMSNVGRLLVVKLDEKLKGELLSYVNNHKIEINTFYYYFIYWVSQNYDSVVRIIKKELKKFREPSEKEQKQEVSRDFDKLIYINSVTNIFGKYALEKGFISDKVDESIKEHISIGLEKALSYSHMRQEAEAKKEAMQKKQNYSRLLCNLVKKGIIKPEKKGSDFFKNKYKGKKCYYIRCSYFISLLSKHYDMSKSKKELTDYFRKNKIGFFGNDGKVIQYKNKKRYLVLRKNRLEEDALRIT